MRQYLDLLQDVLDNGTERDDRTGVGTISVFGRQIRFNMADGFPAVTTKALAWKAVVSELLFFCLGSSNVRRLAEIKNDNKSYEKLTEKEKFTIWNDNYECQAKALGYDNGFLGKIYGFQWRKLHHIDFSRCEIVDDYQYIDTYQKERFEKKSVVLNDKHCGEVYETKNGKLKIIKKISPKDNYSGHIYYEVQFEDTNFSCEARYDAIKNGNIKDPFKEKIFGVGYFGQGVYYDKESFAYKKIKNLWNHMMSRCYNKSDRHYSAYGENGVVVCKRWHNFSNFCGDLEFIYGFYEWMTTCDYELDKDMFGGKVYSPETCVFIPKKYNGRLSVKTVYKYNNNIYIGLKHLAEELGVSYHKLTDHFYKKNKNEYSNIEKFTVPKGQHVRYKMTVCDQLEQVVNEIKNNQNSRRLLVSAWNPVDLPTMALPPCHYSFQFDVDGDKLSLMWNQRSADCFLGIPFNIASYALLLHIVAKMTGKIPHELIGSLGNTHVYKNHIKQVKEQLRRTPHKLPQLELPANADYSNIDSFLKSVKTSDFKLLNYEHDGKLTAPMAV